MVLGQSQLFFSHFHLLYLWPPTLFAFIPDQRCSCMSDDLCKEDLSFNPFNHHQLQSCLIVQSWVHIWFSWSSPPPRVVELKILYGSVFAGWEFWLLCCRVLKKKASKVELKCFWGIKDRIGQDNDTKRPKFPPCFTPIMGSSSESSTPSVGFGELVDRQPWPVTTSTKGGTLKANLDKLGPPTVACCTSSPSTATDCLYFNPLFPSIRSPRSWKTPSGTSSNCALKSTSSTSGFLGSCNS